MISQRILPRAEIQNNQNVLFSPNNNLLIRTITQIIYDPHPSDSITIILTPVLLIAVLELEYTYICRAYNNSGS